MEHVFENIETRFNGTSAVVQLVALILTVTSIYITGLHLFVARAAFVVRLAAWVVLSFAFVFFAYVAFIYAGLLQVLEYCAVCGLPNLHQNLALPGGVSVPFDTFRNAGILVGIGFGVLIYLLL